MWQGAVKLDSGLDIPLYQQLYNFFRGEIISGQLEPLTKLPSVRQLAGGLGISRTTVETAYDQLMAEGYIRSEPKVGYYASRLNTAELADSDLADLLGKDYEKEKPEFQGYDFRSDYVDKESFDFALWRYYINKALKNSGRFLSYGSNRGELELRKEIAKYIHQSRGVVCKPEQIVIGAGVQSLLHILCSLLRDSYGAAGFEDPGFSKGQRIFRDHGLQIVPIPLEEDGLDLGKLSGSGVKLVYISPSHQFPTGTVMTIGKRLELLNWAHSCDGLIIEDDYDSELRYFGLPIPSLQGLDKGQRVIYLGSLSKIFLPSLRISFMVLPPTLLAGAWEVLSQYNQTSSKIEQIALAMFMQAGLLEKHIRRMRKVYARKNQLLTDSIREIMGDKVRVTGNDTGLYALLEVNGARTPEELVKMAEEAGILVTPVSDYATYGTTARYPRILLYYGGISADQIAPAIKKLNLVWFAE